MKLKKEIFYVLPIVIFLLLNELFVPYSVKDLGGENYRNTLLLLSKLLPFGALLYISLTVWKQRRFHVFMCSLPVIYFIYLVFESLYLYGSYFEFPHVGLKMMNLIVTAALFIFYFNRNFTQYGLLMNIIIAALLMKIAVDPSMVTTVAFVEHERGIPSESAYLLLLPCLYYFNVYMVEIKQVALVKFLFLLGFIIFIQHRTVWVATGGALLFNIYLLNRQGQAHLQKVIPGVIPLVLIVLFTTSVVLTYLPGMVGKIQENIENILNPANEGTTSNWRIEQYRSYLPFILEHPLDGMRFQGFELPIQFYNPETSQKHWEEGTGHHFHSFYFDKLFYFGLIGVFIFLFFMVRPFKIVFKEKILLNHRQISFLSFSFSGFIYGLAYDFPIHYYCILGLTLAILERERYRIEESHSTQTTELF